MYINMHMHMTHHARPDKTRRTELIYDQNNTLKAPDTAGRTHASTSTMASITSTMASITSTAALNADRSCQPCACPRRGAWAWDRGTGGPPRLRTTHTHTHTHTHTGDDGVTGQIKDPCDGGCPGECTSAVTYVAGIYVSSNGCRRNICQQDCVPSG